MEIHNSSQASLASVFLYGNQDSRGVSPAETDARLDVAQKLPLEKIRKFMPGK